MILDLWGQSEGFFVLSRLPPSPRRAGLDVRNPIHLSEDEFHPSGAESVRIRFRETEDGLLLSVHDPYSQQRRGAETIRHGVIKLLKVP